MTENKQALLQSQEANRSFSANTWLCRDETGLPLQYWDQTLLEFAVEYATSHHQSNSTTYLWQPSFETAREGVLVADYVSWLSLRACPKMERSGFHKVLPVFLILYVFQC